MSKFPTLNSSQEISRHRSLQVLMYPVVEGKFYSKDLKNDMIVPSVLGTPIRINIYNVSIIGGHR